MIDVFLGLPDIILVVLGFIFLIFGGESVVQGAITIARKMNVSPLLIGFTIVAVGTSLPEFAATFQALQIGAEGIVAGNLVGSNIANILLVGGIMVFPLRSLNIVKQDQSTVIFFISFSILFFFLILLDFTLGFKFGLLFILLLITIGFVI